MIGDGTPREETFEQIMQEYGRMGEYAVDRK